MGMQCRARITGMKSRDSVTGMQHRVSVTGMQHRARVMGMQHRARVTGMQFFFRQCYVGYLGLKLTMWLRITSISLTSLLLKH